jgi:biotin-(acetyl-CoA carboxylase) ligase
MQSLVTQDAALAEVDNPMREVAISACLTADRVAFLERLANEVDAIVEARDTTKMHPVFAEVRQQSALLARLIAALRLPDEATGKRPQKRQVRGVQQPSKVSSLDRARAAKSGA